MHRKVLQIAWRNFSICSGYYAKSDTEMAMPSRSMELEEAVDYNIREKTCQ